MMDQDGRSSVLDESEPIDFERAVLEVVQRSSERATAQPSSVRRAMANYLEPEEVTQKPWETWY